MDPRRQLSTLTYLDEGRRLRDVGLPSSFGTGRQLFEALKGSPRVSSVTELLDAAHMLVAHTRLKHADLSIHLCQSCLGPVSPLLGVLEVLPQLNKLLCQGIDLGLLAHFISIESAVDPSQLTK